MNRMSAVGTIQVQGTVYAARVVCRDDTVIVAKAAALPELKRGLRTLARACDLRLRIINRSDVGASLYKHARAS